MRILFRTICAALAWALVWGSAAASAGAGELPFVTGENGQVLSEVTTVAGSREFANTDGDALSAAFRSPAGIAVLKDGSLLVADTRNHLIRRVADGQVSTYAGFRLLPTDDAGLPLGALLDGDRETAVFNLPTGLDVGRDGSVYVADAGNHAIRKIDVAGAVTTIAGNGVIGAADGQGKKAGFYHPEDVAVTASGIIYVADTLNHTIRKIDPFGRVTTLNAPSSRVVEVIPGDVVEAGDYLDGPIGKAKFNEPSSLALDAKGNLYVADSGNQLIRYIDFKSGMVSTVAGFDPEQGEWSYPERSQYAAGGYVDGPAADARFHYPKGLTLTAEGGLLIADSMNHALRYLFNGEVITLAGNPESRSGMQDGLNGDAQFHNPADTVQLNDGRYAIVDAYNRTVRLFAAVQLPERSATDQGQIRILIGSRQLSKSDYVIRNNRSFISASSFAEAMELDVQSDSQGSYAEFTLGTTTIRLERGDRTLQIVRDSEEPELVELAIAPISVNGMLYVPLRFLSDIVGYDVQWIREHKTVLIRKNSADAFQPLSEGE